ncbi:MAG: hypothetical protein BAJALOKI2v1_290020 [Promethearchaeota archaeon]|nr:MAG: hypothetical protein BAJALOKI2v1_290020 [Candidatus Lokiarchaeota archaeon]
MKKALSYGALFLIVFFSFASYVVADYDYNVPEDELFIYEIKSYDEDVAEDVFVDPDIEVVLGEDAEIGAMFAVEIKDVDDIDNFAGKSGAVDGYQFEGWFWNYFDPSVGWTDDEDDFEDPDESDIQEFTTITLPVDPEELSVGFDLLYIWLVFQYTGVPAPVDEYLDDIDWTDIDVSERTLSYEGTGTIYGTLTEDTEFLWEFGSDGVYQGVKSFNEDGELIYEIALKGGFLSSIPGYQFPLLIGIMSLISIGFLIIVRRRVKN